MVAISSMTDATPRHDALPHPPSVSVLLPAWNSSGSLASCLDALISIDWPDLEIIVCAGGDDDTFAIAQRYEARGVVVIQQHAGEGKQAALRRCLACSHGEIIYLTDADCLVPDHVFRAVLEPIVRGDTVATTGTSQPVPEQLIDPLVLFQWSIVRASERRRPPASTGLLGRNCAVRREAIHQTGSFNEDVPIGTDYHLAKLLVANGVEIRFVPEAVLTYYPQRPGHYLSQQSRWIRNIFLHGRRFNDRREILACGRTIAVGAIFWCWPLTWPWTRTIGILAWLLAFGYLVSARIRYARQLAREQHLRLGPSYAIRLPVYTLLNVAAWARPLVDALSASHRRRW